ncbi:MAG: protein-L-isoaspartate(D-aspartate) O-methyltransferase [Betaproteobacteria bacterium]|jgi:protein-L-isoaspartate(D-aspartate) O-methyltransferase|nr:protein-L-isoaspartate(D-aspartate) O-methyltransferase [Betaproteobacteria bacterium]
MTATADDNTQHRSRMVAEIEQLVRETARETGRAALDSRVIAALRRVERERYVPQQQAAQAYDNRPLAIGAGQTISQPFIVALMTDLMQLRPGDRVLEVGTGSGYQAAVLGELAGTVYTIEIVEQLALEAARALKAAGYRNVHTRIGDGYAGWPEEAPFDAIMVTAAAPGLPQPLVEQLKPGGRLVIPLGASGAVQSLTVIEKDAQGRLIRRKVLDVRFVPFTRTPR